MHSHPFHWPLLALILSCGTFHGFAAEPEPAEITALRREFERRKADALRPVTTWYEGELSRLERSLTVRGNLDAALATRTERAAARSVLAQVSPPAFKAALDDSVWKWNGAAPTEITFRRDGVLECADWGRVGYHIKWQVTAPLVVTYSILKGPANVGQDVKLIFTPDLTSYQGTNADGTPIKPSPRVK